MNAIVIQPEQSLIEEIIPHLKQTGKDYSSNIVVFPGKRPSHFLRKALAGKIGGSFIPPAIFSMDEFIDFLYEGMLPERGRKLETIDAVALLYDIHLKAKKQLGGKSFMTADSFFTIGLKIYRDIEELLIEEINPHLVRDIEPLTQEAIPEQTLQRLQSLSFFYEEFYRTIESMSFSTRALRYSVVSEKAEAANMAHYRQIIFAGFYMLTKSERTLFKKLLQTDNALFIFQHGTGIKESLAGLGINIPGGESEPYKAAAESEAEAEADAGPEISFYMSPDTHGQVFGLSRLLASGAKAGKVLDEKTVIVLPSSETLFPLMRHGLSVIDEDSYNISLGYPLHRTPVFGFLNSLMELITSMDEERVYVPDYLKFALHPYTKNIYFKGAAETTRIIFHAIEEELLKNRTRNFVTLQDIAKEIEGNSRLFSGMMTSLSEEKEGVTAELIAGHLKTIHRNTIERFLSFENVGDFAAKCIGLLTYIYNNSSARLHPFFHPFSESFINHLDTLKCSLMKDVTFVERASYFIFLRKYIMTCHTPFEGTPLKGLQVLGFLETRNIKFDRVFVLDANEEVLPDTRKEDTLLPFRAREILGLPTYIDRDRLSSCYFETLLKGAKELHIFSQENDTAERSRFVEKLLWERQKKDIRTDAKHYLKSIQYKVRLENSGPVNIIKTEAIIGFLRTFSYSATALDHYLKCPLRFYYAYVLKLGEKDEISGDLEKADTGKFVHKVLSEYFSKRRGRQLKEADISLKEMTLSIDELFARDYGVGPSGLTGPAYLLKQQIKKHLKDFLKHYYIPVIRENKTSIIDTEFKIEVPVGGFKLKGRLDLIEKRGDETFILDYKTGANKTYLKINIAALDLEDRASWNNAIGSLQLPFYLLLYSEKSGMAIKALNASFLMLGQTIISREIEMPLFEGPDKETVYELLKTVILRLLNEIVSPELPFSPAADKKKSCPACDFQYLCGTQWITK